MPSSDENSLKECAQCRTIGAFGLSMCGFYIATQCQKFKGIQKTVMGVMAGGFICLGVARFFEVTPFDHPLQQTINKINNKMQ